MPATARRRDPCGSRQAPPPRACTAARDRDASRAPGPRLAVSCPTRTPLSGLPPEVSERGAASGANRYRNSTGVLVRRPGAAQDQGRGLRGRPRGSNCSRSRAMPQGRMSVESCHEVADFQSRIRNFEATAVALDAECFAASVSTIALGDVSVEIMHAQPALLIGAAAARRPGCLIALDGACDACWNGEPVGPHDVAVLAPGVSMSAAFRGAWAGAFISADAEEDGEAVLALRDGGASGRLEPVHIRRADAQA